MIQNVFITGGAGYIGSVLTGLLLSEGYNVTVLDNFLFSQTSLLHLIRNDNLTVIRGDSRDKDLVRSLVEKSDIIIPLACLVGAPICDKDPVGAQTINYDAIEYILSVKRDDQLLVFPNTNSGYGVGDDEEFCTEESSLNPISLYGKLKVAIETEVLKAQGISLRLATVFGVSPRPRLDLLVNDFTFRAVQDRFIVLFESHFKRNYIHVSDVSGAFLHCIKNYESMKGQAFNLGLSDANLSKKELCLEIRKHVESFEIIESDYAKDIDKRNYIVSNDKIENTGFKPKVSLEMGIKELIKVYSFLQNSRFSNV